MIITNIYILGASYPVAGEKPTVLQEVSENTKVLDWQLDSFKRISKKKINFLGGYHIEDIERQYPEINYVHVKNWESNTILDTFFQCPFTNSPSVFTYADTIFRKEALEKITKSKGDVAVAIDLNYKNRYYNRSKADLNIAEIIIPKKGHYAGKKSEFTGLFYIKPEKIDEIISLKSNFNGTSLLGFISFLESLELDVDFINVGSDWTELNEPEDLARFILGNKAQTLSRLAPMVKKSIIGKQISFSVKEWNLENNKIISQIQKVFSKKRVIVRSSTSQEDGWATSNAGKYTSIGDVDSASSKSLVEVVNQVISSYGEVENSIDNFVLVQEFLDNLQLSGVAFTCQLETGAPYTILNFQDNEGSSERITSGISQDDRTIILYNKEEEYLKKLEPKLESVREAIDELKTLLSFDKLDIEFAVDEREMVYILQVRPITLDHRFYDDVSSVFNEKLEKTSNLFSSFQSPRNNLLGDRTLFSNMSDWNPAEIIGTHPNPLAFSLYAYLITDEIWGKQRSEFGYREVLGYPLMIQFCGQPYIDLRASFNSFIPATINNNLAKKLVNSYLDNLSSNPEYHDKIEFDIAFTSWTPSFLEQANERLIRKGFDSQEVSELEGALKDLTVNAMLNFKKHVSMQTLVKRRTEILESNMDYINKFQALLFDCKANGTLGFAHAARHGFIAVSFLKSLVDKKVLTKNEMDKFMSSISGVSSKIQEDQYRLAKGKMSSEEIIAKYGHLRPGTYDASAFAYWEDPEYYLKKENSISIKPSPFKLSKDNKSAIRAMFDNSNLSITPDSLFKYIKEAIILREETKLEFTRNLSCALDCLLKFGEDVGIKRNEIIFLEFNDLQNLILDKINLTQIKEIIQSRIRLDKLNRMFEIPVLIKDKKDFYCFEQYDAQINYITNKKIIGDLVNLNMRKNDNLGGKIVLTKQADPGYDWVFSSNIAGLITEYGGANSHMAIRAAELGLPAAIGIGSKLFNKLSKSNKIKLDCGNDNIIIIN